MQAVTLICCLIAVFATAARAQAISDPQSLYQAHKWSELDRVLQNAKDIPLYRGAIGVTFNCDARRTEKILQAVIRSAPRSEEAYEAYEWLTHLYFYRGQYRRLLSTMEKRWAAFPHKSERQQEQAALIGLRGLPDQTTGKIRPSTLSHESGSIFIPLTVNRHPASYFFDTGAWMSAMSESEAKRLGLHVKEATGTMGTATGARVGFRTAVAPEVVIGQIRFRHVSFLVFPDEQEPWSGLSVGRRGIVGIPLLVSFRTLRWNRVGTAEIGHRSEPLNISRSNLLFDNDHLVVTATVEGRNVRATLDTGAETTDLYKPFADEFADLLKEKGKKDSTEVRGVGHAETFDSVTIPELEFQMGGSETVLRPAHVLLRSIGAKCCVGNFGMDLLKQAPGFKLDFGAMTLQLEPTALP